MVDPADPTLDYIANDARHIEILVRRLQAGDEAKIGSIIQAAKRIIDRAWPLSVLQGAVSASDNGERG